MKKFLIKRVVLLAFGLAPQAAWAQGQSVTPLVSVPAAQVSAQTGGEPGALAFLLFLALTSLVLVGIVKANELRASRLEGAAALESAISDALWDIPGLVSSSAAPTVHLPRCSGAPARIKLAGQVPSAYLAQVALRTAAQVASRMHPRFSLENRMTVGAGPGAPAASQQFFRMHAPVARKERFPWNTASQPR